MLARTDGLQRLTQSLTSMLKRVVFAQITRKLASLQFPRRCTGVLKVPVGRMLEARGEPQSMAAEGSVENILVVASAR
jgi:hypothetical protein